MVKLFDELLNKLNNKERAYLVTPFEVAANSYRNEMLRLSSTGVVFNAPIYSFDGLVMHLFDELGGEKPILIDGLTQEMIVADILSRKAKGDIQSEFFAHAKRSDFAKGIKDTIVEARRSNLTSKNLYAHLANEEKHVKFIEILLEYETILADNNLLDIEGVYNYVSEHSSVVAKDITFYFEEIYNLTPIHIKLINAIAKVSKECKLVFHNISDNTLRKWFETIKSRFVGVDIECLEVDANNELKVKILKAPTQALEAREVARYIKELIKKEGFEPKDICVAINQSSDSYGKLYQVFEESGIQNDMKHRDLLSSFLIVSSCVDIFVGAAKKFDKFDLMKIYSQTNKGSMNNEIAWLRRKFEKRSMRLKLSQWEMRTRDNGDFVRFLTKLKAAWNSIDLNKEYTLEELVNISRLVIKHMQIESNILSIPDPNNRVMVWSHWNVFLELLKKLESIAAISLANLRWTWEEYANFLKSIVSKKTVDSKDHQKGVHVISPYDILGQSFKILILVGMSEGQFPYVKHGGWIFTRRDREILHGKGVVLTRANDEDIIAKAALYSAMKFTKECLTITYAEADDEASVLSATPILGQMVPQHCEVEPFPAVGADIISAKEYSIHLSKNQDISSATSDDIKAIISRLREVNSDVYTSYDGILCDEALISRIKSQLMSNDTWSASTLKNYIECPFKYLCNSLLKVKEYGDMDEEARPLDMGTVGHEILKNTFKEYKGRYIGRETECAQYVNEIAQKELERVDIDKVDISESVWELQKNNFITKLQAVVANEMEIICDDSKQRNWNPTYFEWSFGQKIEEGYNDENSTTEPLILVHKGEELRFRGTIDRIDVDYEHNMALYDYKLGNAPMPSDIGKNIDIQIALYILAAGKLLANSVSNVLGGTYISIKEKKRDSGMWQKPFANELGFRGNKSNVFDEDSWLELEGRMSEYLYGVISGIKAGRFDIKPVKACKDLHCPYIDICGYDKNTYDKKR